MDIEDLTFETISTLKNGKLFTNLKIKAANLGNAKRNNVAIICVLDISGSMDSEATQGQSKQSDGFSRLDLVKHSVNTIIHSLGQGDMLGVVTFSDKARVDFPLQTMQQDSKTKALTMIKNMRTQGCTNLWDGIKTGLQLSKSEKCVDKNTFVVVLSDGQPNQHPEGGQLKALKDYLVEYPLTCNLNMFGYGYSLDTKLLTAITQLGGGCYGFIPDCSMVGTIFVNFLSHALSSFTSLMTLEVNTAKGKFIRLNGKDHFKVLLGAVQFGFTRNALIVFQETVQGQQVAEIKIKYGKRLRSEKTIKLIAQSRGDQKEVKIQSLRYKYINFLNSAIQLGANNQLNIAKADQQKLVQQMQISNNELKDEYLQSLILDMKSKSQAQGQVGKALQNQQWWKKWGKHYLPALQIAHNIEMCTNFKDPGLQGYASQLFRQNQGNIDTVFIKLPPPTPTIKKYDAQGNTRQVNNMAGYYNRCGGCIHGDCNAVLQNGQTRLVSQLVKGDVVKTHIGYSKIVCVIQTLVNESIQMVHFPNGLIITPYHPVLDVVSSRWKFPTSLITPISTAITSHYNLVLQQGHSILINDVYCITLGHNMKDDVLQHQYLGTDKVINDLRKVRGYQYGRVVLSKDAMKRNPQTLLIQAMLIQL